jgi:ribonucleoside-triphosphate reductase
LQNNIKLGKNFTTTFNKLCEKYGEEFEKINGFSESNLNLSGFVDNFIDSDNTANSTIDANANVQSKDICNLINEIPKPFLKLLGYNKLFYEAQKKYGIKFAREMFEADWKGDIFIHNASDISLRPYCFNYDLEALATRGMFFINNLKTLPAKHLTTFCDHLLEFISWVTNRQSGASGIANALMWLFWFWKNDVEQEHYIKSPEYYRDQCFQKLIFDLNMPYLRITQTAYTNISIYDRAYCMEMFGGLVYPDGKLFVDYIDEFIDFQKAFLNKFSEMREENLYTYPVLTYCLVYRNGKFEDEEFAHWCSNHNMKWADSNFLISPDTTSAASCCRLLSDTTKLKGVMNSIGGSSLDIGSVSVVTLNIAAYAEQAQSINEFFDILTNNVHLVIKTNDIVRHIIKRNIEKGLLPNYSYGLMKLDKQFCTIGINGIWEAVKKFNLAKCDENDYWSYTDEGIEFASAILDKINAIKDSYNFNYSINIEQTPMENGAIKLAKKNELLYGTTDYITANQWIALKDKATIQERAKIAGILDNKCGGGCITHCQIDAPFNNEEVAWKMLNYIASQGVIYFAFNLKINIDKNKHSFTTNKCAICGESPSDTYQRVVGYLVPTSSWSEGRKKELNERDWMNLNDVIL